MGCIRAMKRGREGRGTLLRRKRKRSICMDIYTIERNCLETHDCLVTAHVDVPVIRRRRLGRQTPSARPATTRRTRPRG